MVVRSQKTVDPRSPGKEKKAAENQVAADKDDTCRCKEASKMTPRELLGLMFSDLAFWKKVNKG